MKQIFAHFIRHWLVICLVISAGCAETDVKKRLALPPNAQSEFLKTMSVDIQLNKNVFPTETRYAIRLKILKELSDTAAALFAFENPDPAGHPLEIIDKLKPGQTEIFTVSPPVACISNDRQYRITVTLYASADRRILLGRHEQRVAFQVPPIMLRALRVAECH